MSCFGFGQQDDAFAQFIIGEGQIGATNHRICSGEGGADRTRRGAERRVSALQPCLMSEVV